MPSIFEEVPVDLDERWYHGFLVGGMALWRDAGDLAEIYRRNGDALIDRALDEQDLSNQYAYPALYLYRHALELYLKAILGDAKKVHKLDDMVGSLETSGKAPGWLLVTLREFASVDPDAQAFRFHDGRIGEALEAESWVDFRNLQEAMRAACAVLTELVHQGKQTEERTAPAS